jgi:glycerol kinase
MVVNDWLCQFLADVLDRPVERPAVVETTALGAAYLAGLATGFWRGADEIAAQWRADRRFEPRLRETERVAKLARWREAVDRSKGWARS